MRFRVRHVTEYRYGASVAGSQTIAHLVPRATPMQQVVSSIVTSDPAAAHRVDHEDAFGNTATYLAVEVPHDRLVVIGSCEVDVAPSRQPASSAAWEDAAAVTEAGRSDDGLLARLCRVPSPLVEVSDELASYAQPSFGPGRPLHQAVIDLTGRIHRDFLFDSSFTDVATPLGEVLAWRRGVCQDFAHLAIGCLRSIGLPARYVSGYIETEPPPGQPKLLGVDASHAWFSAYIPGWGWLDADPTNDQVPPARHVTVAWGRDYGDVAPVRGVVFGPPAPQELTVSVDVTQVD